MYTAKLIRHRHIHEETDTLNGRLVHHEISHEDHFKIVFSDNDEYMAFSNWCIKEGGNYNYNRATNKQDGELPEGAKSGFNEDVGWCDLITYYLLHVAGYQFHSVIADVSFKGEVYIKP